jgi:hypothetical protein
MPAAASQPISSRRVAPRRIAAWTSLFAASSIVPPPVSPAL